MPLYTFHIEHEGKIYVDQVLQQSLRKAQYDWLTDIDFQRYKVKNIEEYNDFVKHAKELECPPIVITANINNWRMTPMFQDGEMYIHIVKTFEKEKPSEIEHNGLYTVLFNFSRGYGIFQVNGAKSVNEVLPLWVKQHSADMFGDYKEITKKEFAELGKQLSKTKLTKQKDLFNVWGKKLKFMGNELVIYVVPTSKE